MYLTIQAINLQFFAAKVWEQNEYFATSLGNSNPASLQLLLTKEMNLNWNNKVHLSMT